MGNAGQPQAYPNNVEVVWRRREGAAETEPATTVAATYREHRRTHTLDVGPTDGYSEVESQLRAAFGLHGVGVVEFHHYGVIPLGAFAGPPNPPPPR